MWTFKAWAEWRVPRNGTGRQGGRVAGPHLAPEGRLGGGRGPTRRGEDLKSGSGRQSRQGTLGQPLRRHLNQVVSAQAGARPREAG